MHWEQHNFLSLWCLRSIWPTTMFVVINVSKSRLEQKLLMPSTSLTATVCKYHKFHKFTDKGTSKQSVISTSPQDMWNDNFNVKKYQSRLSTCRGSLEWGEGREESGKRNKFLTFYRCTIPLIEQWKRLLLFKRCTTCLFRPRGVLKCQKPASIPPSISTLNKYWYNSLPPTPKVRAW